MRVIETIDELRVALEGARRSGVGVGFVPTMGYLHRGHASLIEAAANDCDEVVASIFVNPLQFAPNEDLSSYPRDLEADLALAEAAGATIVFAPAGGEMYPEPVVTTVSVAELSERMEGASRPTHFAGVATVVTKLFSIVGPCRAYFGEKDYQQLAVVRRMVSDLSMPIDVVGCPIVREDDGLAMSSRNVYLTEAERAAAPVLQRSLRLAAAAIEAGEVATVAEARQMVAGPIDAEPLTMLDYAEIVDVATLAPAAELVGELRLIVAAQVGRPRLLDNVGATAP